MYEKSCRDDSDTFLTIHWFDESWMHKPSQKTLTWHRSRPWSLSESAGSPLGKPTVAPQLLNQARLEASCVFEAQKPEPRRNAEASKRRRLQSRLPQEGMALQGLTEGDMRSCSGSWPLSDVASTCLAGLWQLSLSSQSVERNPHLTIVLFQFWILQAEQCQSTVTCQIIPDPFIHERAHVSPIAVANSLFSRKRDSNDLIWQAGRNACMQRVGSTVFCLN